MALTPSTMIPLGTEAPDFKLSDFSGKRYSLKDFKDYRALLVVFMCNHCPYVKHIKPFFSKWVADQQDRGLGVVGINANDAETNPDDNPAQMAIDADEFDYTFPYLVDEKQETAKDYNAACTPDFFLFDEDRRLVYRGQFDDSRPGNDKPVTGADLTAYVDMLLEGKPAPEKQLPSMGCNIKWKPGNEPEYFNLT